MPGEAMMTTGWLASKCAMDLSSVMCSNFQGLRTSWAERICSFIMLM
jgi:hypothetical protein